MKVGIVGCGTAGAAAAIMLSHQGADVSVFERVPSPKPIGAGIMLQPTGQAVLARMGLLQPIAERGARIDRLWFRTPSGRTIVDMQ
jgi:2-polyprenyl-6-methoxyphenol hydroxylase-like FAD-dependent oxidoreductase